MAPEVRTAITGPEMLGDMDLVSPPMVGEKGCG